MKRSDHKYKLFVTQNMTCLVYTAVMLTLLVAKGL